jgi:2,5-furandicarboxylate decarboxylase 1
MPKDLRSYLDLLEKTLPHELLRIDKPVDPAGYGVTALLQQLEDRRLFPTVLFSNPLNLQGGASLFPVIANLYSSRQKLALAMGLSPDDWKQTLSLKYSAAEKDLKRPIALGSAEAPVKEVTKVGAEVNLDVFPIVRHHAMDPAPYIVMGVGFKDPAEGFTNFALQRMMYRGPRELGLQMAHRHSWELCRRYGDLGRKAPVVVVVSHHPAFYLGALNVQPLGIDDYHVIGGVMGEPVRLAPSETWGKEIMVPADADLVLEGEVQFDRMETEGPFGEFTRYSGPQKLGWVIDVTAVTHRKKAIYQDVFVGHRENWLMGGLPKEGDVYLAVKEVVPTVQSVCFAVSGACRFNCYISIDKKREGEPRLAAFAALETVDYVKNVIVVDADVDPYNEEAVMWAVATRTQADRDLEVLKDVVSSRLDPSLNTQQLGAKVIIDATAPLDRPFEELIRIPQTALEQYPLFEYVDETRLKAIQQLTDRE